MTAVCSGATPTPLQRGQNGPVCASVPAAPEKPTNGHNGRHGGHANSIINLTPPIVSCETVGGFFLLEGGEMNVFEAVKHAVTARQAAEHYGIRVNEHGMAVCHIGFLGF